MRIAHFLLGRCNPDSANGVDKTIFYLSRAQAELGHDVAVFSITNKPPVSFGEISAHQFPPARLPFTVPRALVKELVEWQPDIVHLHSVYVPANAALAAELMNRKIPYVISAHGGLSPFVLARRRAVKGLYKVLVEKRLFDNAAFVHAISDDLDIRNYGVTAPVVSAVNGFDRSVIPAEVGSDRLLERYPNLYGRRLFVFIGRLDPVHKGLDLFLDAFSKALTETENIACVVIGPDWRGGRETVEQHIFDLELHDHVILWGEAYGEEKYDLLSSADVFVHTSRWEGIPFAVLEAMGSGKPCLVTPVADPLGLIGARGAGCVVQPDVEDIAGGIVRLARAPESELVIQGRNAMDIIDSHFRWRDSAETLVQAYVEYGSAAAS